MSRVHIKIADEGWILEKCASEISARSSGISFGTHSDPSAEIQYYVNYSASAERISPVEVAFFTHSEKDERARRRYFEAAASVDHCVCMSQRYAQELIDFGVPAEKVTTIAPGVDLDKFRPKIRIGVVGRTYHTGRKGEDLIAEVMDIPSIEWRFTGSGWPGPSTNVPDGGMADFYNELDYVLIPSHYEGGPMSVLEGLACGVPIISSDIGWVNEYPHIPFENGSAQSLREVLTSLIAKRETLRASVLDRTWDRWAEGHLQLFDRLLGRSSIATAVGPSAGCTADVRLLTHGTEGIAKGGPSVRVPRTVAALREIGVAATCSNFPSEGSLDDNLVHLFNVWPPRSSVEAARAVARANKRLVLSPILLDLSEIDFWQNRVLEEVSGAVDEVLLRRLEFEYSERQTWSVRRNAEPGFVSSVRELSELSDGIIFLSKREQALFEELAGPHDCTSLIRNPVDVRGFGQADPRIFREFIGLEDFILCVGRIEPRKNQLFLAAAAKRLGLPLVLIGHPGGNGTYAQAISSFGGDSVRLVGRLEPQSDLLRSAYAACRVFALPSWAEGAPLAALEAAAAGANMVLSDRSGEQEYFGDLARYVNPASIEDLEAALAAAWNDKHGEERHSAIQQKVQDDFSWELYAERTAALYRRALERKPKEPTQRQHMRSAMLPNNGPIFVELSTSRNAKEITGINRVEAFACRELAERYGDNLHFVVWNHPTNSFQEVPRNVVLEGSVRNFLESGAAQTLRRGEGGGHLVVLGSGWFQNSAYAEAMGVLARSHELQLNVLIHDIIPALRPHWFPEKYAPVFVENLRAMLRSANRVLIYSENTAVDVRRFAEQNGIDCPTLFRIRLAGEIGPADNSIDAQPFANASFVASKFILSVGAIHKRKNYELLYDCWVELSKRLGTSCPHLVIVGGIGWDGRDSSRAFKEDPRLAGRVHILKGVGDQGLGWLYRNCLFTVYPSLYEGWGLPVAESLAAGKLVLASNVSSVPEIAPELCELIDPLDRAAWVAKIMHYSLSEASRLRRENEIHARFAPVKWAETVDGILDALDQPVVPNSQQDFYSLGEVIRLSKQGGQRHKINGWHLSEGFGSWTAEKHAGLRFILGTLPREDLIVAVTLRIFGKDGTVRVTANGSRIAEWDISAGCDVLRFALVPKELVREDGCLLLEFESPRVIPVRALNPKSGDARSLGVGVSAVQVMEQSSDELFNGIAVLRQLPVNKPIPTSSLAGFVHAQAFHPPEPTGLWSKFTESEMTFRLAHTGPLLLRLEVWAPLAKSAGARIVVFSGAGRREVRLHGGENEVVWVPIEATPGNFCRAVFQVDTMFVPAVHHGTDDKRELGILVKSVAVLNAKEDEVPTQISMPDAAPSARARGWRPRIRRIATALR